MGTNTRYANTAISQNLQTQTFQFDFHQAVELIQQMNPNCVPLGEGTDPSKEALKIKARVSMSPSSAQIHSFSPPKHPFEQPTLWVNFLGIAGVQGPLPTPYTEFLMDRTRQNDMAFRDFLDIFNHRLGSLWHRLKKKTFISFSQPDPRKTQIGNALLSLCGLNDKAKRAMLHVNDRTLLGYHDLIWRRPKSSYGLIRILSTHYDVPVRVEQFQGGYVRAQELDVTRLGQRFHALGVDTLLGDKRWDQSMGIRIDMGPVSWRLLTRFLPQKIYDEMGKTLCGEDFQSLKDLVRFYVGSDYRVKIRFFIHAFNVKPLRLNRRFSLGHNSWLTIGKPLQHPCQVDFWLT